MRSLRQFGWIIVAIFGLSGVSAPTLAAQEALTATGLTTDGRVEPLAVDRLPVRLGWQLANGPRGVLQTSYRIQAASNAALLTAGTPDLWDSGTVTSSVSQHVAWGGPALSSGQVVHWRVRVGTTDGASSAWSAPTRFVMGLLDEAAWAGATWITAPVAVDQSPLLRRGFSINKPVRAAYLSICGLGYFEAFLNGTKIGDHVLDPGWSSFHKRAYYVTFDVSSQIQQGDNALGVELANGALRGLTQGGHPSFAMDNAWFSTPRLRARLRIVHTDGSSTDVVSNNQWRWRSGPVKANDFFRAVTYDARDEIPGWSTAAFDDSSWSAAQNSTSSSQILQAQHFPPCRVVETLAPVSLTTRSGTTTGGEPATIYRFDFARNIPGWLQLRNLNAPAGTDLRITYWEPHKDWGQWDRYICKGGGNETWEPRFAYHGFQYAEVTVPNSAGIVLTSDNVRARRVHTDFPDNGTFRSSNPVFSRLLDAFKLSYVGNYHSIPTDCPTREKAGWMADAHLVAEAGMYYFGNTTAYDKFLRDCLDNQLTTGVDIGGVPSVVPSKQAWAGTSNSFGGPAWSAAYPIIVWSLYERSGDRDLLALHYPRLKAYADFVSNRLCDNNTDSADNGFIVTRTGLGDWGGQNLDTTHKRLTATSYHYQATLIVANIATALGHNAEATSYANRATTIANRFNAVFRSGPGTYTEARPLRGIACALFQGLVPTAERSAAANNLAAGLTSDWQWMGALTPRWALQELSRNGHVDKAYAAVARTDRNWARWTEQLGSSTLWEFWTNTNESLNHAFMGMFTTWYIEDVLGIRPLASHPGYTRFTVHPELPTALNWAEGHFDSVRGRIAMAWRREAGGLVVELTVPGNSVAELHLPAAGPGNVTESGMPAANATGVTYVGVIGSRSVFTVGAGTYTFTITDGVALPTVSIVATDPNAAEADGGTVNTGTWTLTRTGSTSSSLTINVSVVGGTATPADYQPIPNSVTVPAGQASATITLTPVDDDLTEGPETVILGIAPGSYTIGSPATATITIAMSDNDAPVVNAGANRTVAGLSTVLAGSATDDGRPSPANLTIVWTTVSGPGPVTFTNASSPSTAVTFSQAGTYVLRLSATDGMLSAQDDVTLTVTLASPLIAMASANVTSGPAPLTVSLTGTASGGQPQPTVGAHQDIGSVTASGDASYANGVWTVSGSGADIWDAADAFHFVYVPMSGDGQITARVTSLTNTHAWAKAGVMIRESLAPGAKHATCVVTPGNGASFQRRASTGGSSASTAGGAYTFPNAWLRMQRSGSTLTASISTDGQAWTIIGSQSIAMATEVLVGLAVCSHNNGVVSTATFDNVSPALGGSGYTYNWDLNGDGVTDATGAQLQHVFTQPGLVTVTLTVSDGHTTATDDLELIISEALRNRSIIMNRLADSLWDALAPLDAVIDPANSNTQEIRVESGQNAVLVPIPDPSAIN